MKKQKDITKHIKDKMKTTIILPCMNEEKTIGKVIEDINKVMKGEDYEIIVSNNSIDDSGMMAIEKGAIVIEHNRIGYGASYLAVINNINSDYIVMADCDGTYNMKEIPKLIKWLKKGMDLVIGKREIVNIPWINYIGNRILTRRFNKIFKTDLTDTHSGFRAIKTNVLKKLNLKEQGWEFAIEMLAKAVRNKVKIKELYTEYYKRKEPSKLKPFRDGWSHWKYLKRLEDETRKERRL